MDLRNARKNPSTMLRLGLSALVVALLFNRFVQPTPSFPESARDAASGLLFGIAIGVLLVAIRLKRRPPSREDPAA